MLFIFDMGGVVTTNFDMDKVYKKLNLSEAEFKSLCNFDNRNIFSELEIGNIQVQEFWALFNSQAGKNNIKLVDKDLFRLFFHPQLNPDTVKIINKLKSKHRVICGTNTIQSHWENHLERGDYALFDQTYASNKIGVAKPNCAYFETILEAENCSAKDAFFVDDKLCNVEAALKCGINAVQFISAQQLSAEWEKYY